MSWVTVGADIVHVDVLKESKASKGMPDERARQVICASWHDRHERTSYSFNPAPSMHAVLLARMSQLRRQKAAVR